MNESVNGKATIRPGFLTLAITCLVLGTAGALALLFFSLTPKRVTLTSEETGIIQRASERTGASESVWTEKLRSGQASLDLCLRTIFTGTDYLLKGGDDENFASDLSYVLSGNETNKENLEAASSGNSRVYVIAQSLFAMNPNYAPEFLSFSSDTKGTQIEDVSLAQSLQDDEGYCFGIRKVSGTIRIKGDDARTDFYIDGDLRPGQLEISDSTEENKAFSMAWDTRKEAAGNHSVQILLRTSDGRGRILSGGDIDIPAFYTLINDGVQKGSLPASDADVWYQLDAKERNAYINFVDANGDIKVTLYDMYGNRIGTNDQTGDGPEVLRGQRQDLSASVGNDPFVGPFTNTFYARVQRGAAETFIGEIDYRMVQSKEVAVTPDGTYVAVVSAVGAVPTLVPTSPVSEDEANANVECRDLNNNQLTFKRSDLTFLPLNGQLTSLSFLLSGQSSALRIYPQFAVGTNDYAYVSPTVLDGSIRVQYTTVEGYAAKVSVVNTTESGVVPAADDEITPASSRNQITIRVLDFDGVEHVSNFYLLSGADSGGYDVSTLNQFPESYRSGLWLLHNLRPSYLFQPLNTGIEWADCLAAQDNKDKSLANDSTNPNWVKPDSPVYDGSGWRAAKTDVVSYFLDPRNFLTPISIFQFEKLSYDENIHTIDGVRSLVKGTFLAGTDPDYASILLQAGKEAGISPYFLSSRILQEMGRNGESKLCSGTLSGYEGYYNFYNIGSTPDPSVKDGALINGAKFAKWGKDASAMTITDDEKAILLPWTSPDLAIRGGALWIASSYVNVGQNTLYFQKFDVIQNEDGLYLHQYAQNISMAYSEGARYYTAYRSEDMLGSEFLFLIPIYQNMPDYVGVMPIA